MIQYVETRIVYNVAMGTAYSQMLGYHLGRFQVWAGGGHRPPSNPQIFDT